MAVSTRRSRSGMPHGRLGLKRKTSASCVSGTTMFCGIQPECSMRSAERLENISLTAKRTPHPNPPPQGGRGLIPLPRFRSEEHTSELQSLMRISYAVFCLKNKNKKAITTLKKTDKKNNSQT